MWLQLGNFIHYMATFVSGFVVGFTAAWQLALVTLAVAPLIAVIGVIHTTTMAKLSSKSQVALSEASNVAEQVLSSTPAALSTSQDQIPSHGFLPFVRKWGESTGAGSN